MEKNEIEFIDNLIGEILTKQKHPSLEDIDAISLMMGKYGEIDDPDKNAQLTNLIKKLDEAMANPFSRLVVEEDED